MNVIVPLIQFQQQLRIFHWQTTSFAQHKAFGKIYGNLDGLIDKFVESFMGIFGRAKANITFQINLMSFNDENVEQSIVNFEQYLQSMDQEPTLTTDLLNIRDELLGETHTLRYLLSLN